MQYQGDAERLFAEHAVPARRALMNATRGPARTQGLAVAQAALNAQGRALLNRMLLEVLQEQEGAEIRAKLRTVGLRKAVARKRALSRHCRPPAG